MRHDGGSLASAQTNHRLRSFAETMSRPHRPHKEKHLVNRIGWLRAAVLGANDGIISTASLIVGVAAAAGKQNDVLIAGVSGHRRTDLL